MAVRPLRRLGAPVDSSLAGRINSQLIHSGERKQDLDAIEREHPELVVERGDNILSAVPRGDARLVYGFENDRAFVQLFPEMFDELLPSVLRAFRPERLRLRFSYAPARPVVEPVLRNLSFAPVRHWLGFTFPQGRRLPSSSVAGVRFRDGTTEDVATMQRLDRAAFPDTPVPSSYIRERLEEGEQAIIAEVGGDMAGFCLFGEIPEERLGWINILAVDEAFRGRGIGSALTVRAAKRLFAAGMDRVGLTTDEDNGAGIRMYVKLGFQQSSAGRDYERPADPKAIQKLWNESRGTLIKFGGWR